MANLVLQPTQTAQWHALVNEAQFAIHRELGEMLESYLVFLLMRFIQKPAIASTILALEYLEGLKSHGHLQFDKLRDVGDQCLLFSGLFPGRAHKKRVKLTYFVDIGRSAYDILANTTTPHNNPVYAQLSQDFIPVMEVLHAMRALDPLQEPPFWTKTKLNTQFIWPDPSSEYQPPKFTKN